MRRKWKNPHEKSFARDEKSRNFRINLEVSIITRPFPVKNLLSNPINLF